MKSQLNVTVSGGDYDERQALAGVITAALDHAEVDVEGRCGITLFSEAKLMVASRVAPVRVSIIEDSHVLEGNRLI